MKFNSIKRLQELYELAADAGILIPCYVYDGKIVYGKITSNVIEIVHPFN